MAALIIRWSNTAIFQRDHIFEYWLIRNKSNQYEISLNRAIKKKTGLLRKTPELGRKTNREDVRIHSMKHYSIIYKFDEIHLDNISFWDNRQDSKSLADYLAHL
jgi:plasmid stabilization system protein ParE